MMFKFLFYILIDLQGSQTSYITTLPMPMFYILIDLQGSQTVWQALRYTMMFYILIDLQGSQTLSRLSRNTKLFYILIDLQGSQTSKFTLSLSPNHSYWYMCNQNSIRQLLSSRIYVCS